MSVAVAATSLAGLALKLAPAFDQANGLFIALLLPLETAVVSG
jgi:hypothetical protein